MNQEKIKALAEELAKDLKTPADLNALSAQLTKITYLHYVYMGISGQGAKLLKLT